jgi:hypothetical protein
VGLILGGVKQKTMKLVFVASALNIQAIKNKHWLAQSQVTALAIKNKHWLAQSQVTALAIKNKHWLAQSG